MQHRAGASDASNSAGDALQHYSAGYSHDMRIRPLQSFLGIKTEAVADTMHSVGSLAVNPPRATIHRRVPRLGGVPTDAAAHLPKPASLEQLNVAKAPVSLYSAHKADSSATLFEGEPLHAMSGSANASQNPFRLPPLDATSHRALQKTSSPPSSPASMSASTASLAHARATDPRAFYTPQEALYELSHLLSPYEQQEIAQYAEIYYVGCASHLKLGPHQTGHVDTLTATNDDEDDAELHGKSTYVNKGSGGAMQAHFDDLRGDYRIVRDDHLAYRYRIEAILGKGSFGQVVRAQDYKTGRPVAIKLIRNEARFEKQGLVELKVLQHVTDADQKSGAGHHVVHMLDHFRFRNHLCIVFELMGSNLYEWLKVGEFHGLHIGLIQSFAYQITQGLSLLASQRIVHCDLKPENILLESTVSKRPAARDLHTATNGGRVRGDRTQYAGAEYQIRVIDFGSACFANERVFSYIQSRFYRSPEVILGIEYNTAIDMWSLGCILVELYIGYPLFPGENEQDQLACIMLYRGVPPAQLLARATRRHHFFDSHNRPRPFVNSKGKSRAPGSRTLYDVMRCKDTQFLDFLERCLDWDPATRLTPQQALLHPWVYRGAERPVVAPVVDTAVPLRQSAGMSSASSSSSIECSSLRSSDSVASLASSSSASLTAATPATVLVAPVVQLMAQQPSAFTLPSPTRHGNAVRATAGATGVQTRSSRYAVRSAGTSHVVPSGHAAMAAEPGQAGGSLALKGSALFRKPMLLYAKAPQATSAQAAAAAAQRQVCTGTLVHGTSRRGGLSTSANDGTAQISAVAGTLSLDTRASVRHHAHPRPAPSHQLPFASSAHSAVSLAPLQPAAVPGLDVFSSVRRFFAGTTVGGKPPTAG